MQPLLGRSDVVADERSAINVAREMHGVKTNASSNLIGLALSGGGIRSAAISIGVLQGLARRRLLSTFDYLSTVSGGSYAGAWLTAYICRQGLSTVERDLSSSGGEPFAVSYVRANCGYLRSRFELGVVYFTGFAGNAVLLLALCSLLTLLPRFWFASLRPLSDPYWHEAVIEIWGGAILAWVLVAVVAVRPAKARTAISGCTALIAAAMCTRGLAVLMHNRYLANSLDTYEIFSWPLGMAIVSCLVHVITNILLSNATTGTVLRRLFQICKNGAVCGLVTAAALLYIGLGGSSLIQGGGVEDRLLWIGVTGPSLLISAWATASVLILRSTQARDWVSSVAVSSTILARAFIWSFAWTLLSMLIWQASRICSNTTATGWLMVAACGAVALVGAAVLGLRYKTAVWAQLVIAGCALVSGSYVIALIARAQGDSIAGLEKWMPWGYYFHSGHRSVTLDLLDANWTSLAVALILTSLYVYYAAGVLNSTTVPINQLYASRISETFLRASLLSPESSGNVYGSGTCDLSMADLALVRPFPIVNMTLSLPQSREVLVERGVVAPFTVTPLHVGTERLGYSHIKHYAGDLTLARCVGVSGAAVAPTLGRHAGTLSTVSMTLLNFRLGSWFTNPRFARTPTWRALVPRSLVALMNEAFSLGSESSHYVHLSDGGHFDNLGIYELVARRCSIIVVFDNTFDPGLTCADLADSIRKIHIGLPRVLIEIDVTEIRNHKQHYAVGTIRNEQVGETGVLIYVKSSLTGDEPLGLTIGTHPDGDTFPHNTTSNQFFSEAQFERYRALGEHLAHSIPPEFSQVVG